MRLSTNQIFNQGVDSILDAQQRLTKAQDKITNQTHLLTPSEDPAATAQVMRLNEKIELTAQYEANGVILQNKLNNEEVALNALKNSMDRIKVLVIQAGSGSLSDADRSGIAFELESLKDEMFDLMNTKDANGDFVFSGFQSKTQPFVFNQTTQTYDYQGDEGELKLQLSSSVTLAANDNGKKLFEDVDARLRVNNVTSSAGVPGSFVTVENQDVFNAFHTANFDTATAANNSYNVTVTAPNNYSITNAGTGAAVAAGTYALGEGIDFQGMKIKPGGTAGTIGFTLSTPGKSNILTTINDLTNALNTPGGYTPAMSEELKDAMVQTNNAKDQIHMVQSSLGGRLNVASRIMSTNVEINHANQKTRSDVAEIDYAEAVTELMKEESALEAAQATFSRISRLNLFDFIN